MAADGTTLAPGSLALAQRCREVGEGATLPLACSGEALAHVLRAIGHTGAGNLLGLAVFIALPSVILTMIYGQTRIFFVMSRDGLLPGALSQVHPRFQTPHVVTMVTGLGVVVGAAFFPVGRLADISNSGTLFAFLVVSVAVMLLRRRDPGRHRPFRTPFVWVIGPLSVVGCIVLFLYLPPAAQLVFPIWGALGLTFYWLYGRHRSHMRSSRVVEALPQEA
jgi:APA family basic amino acid/polyamine antiporter